MTLIDLTVPVMRGSRLTGLPVAVIGAGPIGLAAAAHLLERGLPVEVFEAGAIAGTAVASWGHTRLFSPWSMLVDAAAARLLASSGWRAPHPDALPTGTELVRDYLAMLAALPQIAEHVHYGARVIAVSREGMDRTRSAGRADTPFVLRIVGPEGAREVTARAVIDASGTTSTPNRLGASGLDPLGAAEVAELISPALPDVLGRDRARFAGRRTLVVGAGHSAANTLIALARLAELEPGTTVSWAIRGASAVRVSSAEGDALEARASIGSRVDRLVASGSVELLERFEIVGLARDGGSAIVSARRAGELVAVRADRIVNATGFRPDLDLLRELRLDLDEVVEAPRALAPLIDPNLHSCGTVEPHGVRELRHPEPDFFVAGMKSYGRAPTFLLATGYEQVRSIAAWLAGDLAAAEAVELVLPATGVCSTEDASGAPGSCCR